jgi:hypothetical protein
MTIQPPNYNENPEWTETTYKDWNDSIIRIQSVLQGFFDRKNRKGAYRRSENGQRIIVSQWYCSFFWMDHSQTKDASWLELPKVMMQ